jgi:hypothetical protein
MTSDNRVLDHHVVPEAGGLTTHGSARSWSIDEGVVPAIPSPYYHY